MPGSKQRRRQPRLDLGEEARPRFRGGGFLQSLRLETPPSLDIWPFNMPMVRALAEMECLEFHPAVTFFIGENGSGKSTLLEAIAVRMGFSIEGGWKKRTAEEFGADSSLHGFLRVGRQAYHTDGWYLRAESFYNVASELEKLDREPFCAHGHAAYGGKPLHAQSHGEAFLALLTNRLQGHGLYLFDEPEAALSPQRQLSVLTLLHRLVYHESQLIIATHSPILLAYPHARIYEFSNEGLREVKYEETETFRVTRDFLQQPARMLDLLLRAEEEDLEKARR